MTFSEEWAMDHPGMEPDEMDECPWDRGPGNECSPYEDCIKCKNREIDKPYYYCR